MILGVNVGVGVSEGVGKSVGESVGEGEGEDEGEGEGEGQGEGEGVGVVCCGETNTAWNSLSIFAKSFPQTLDRLNSSSPGNE